MAYSFRESAAATSTVADGRSVRAPSVIGDVASRGPVSARNSSGVPRVRRRRSIARHTLRTRTTPTVLRGRESPSRRRSGWTPCTSDNAPPSSARSIPIGRFLASMCIRGGLAPATDRLRRDGRGRHSSCASCNLPPGLDATGCVERRRGLQPTVSGGQVAVGAESDLKGVLVVERVADVVEFGAQL